MASLIAIGLLLCSFSVVYAAPEDFMIDPTGRLTAYTGTDVEIVIPDTVTSIAPEAFQNNRTVTCVTIPAGVTEIEAGTFKGCYRLETCIFLGDAPALSENAFENATASMISIVYPDAASGFAYPAWNGYACRPMSMIDYVTDKNGALIDYRGEETDITIPDSITAIKGAFGGYQLLQSVHIPAGVDMENNAFGACPNLTTITVDETHPSLTVEDGVLFNKDKTKIICYPAGKAGTSYTIPDSVTTIGYMAFGAHKTLESITIPSSVTTIESYAFYNNTGLKNLVIPDSVTSLGETAFGGCSGLQSVDISDNVTELLDSTFIDCSSLEQVELPENLERIRDTVFHECSSLQEITIPAGVTRIGSAAFAGCASLDKVIYEGNAPEMFFSTVFQAGSPNLTSYYYPGATGFTTPEWNGYPCYPIEAGEPQQKISELSAQEQPAALYKLLAKLGLTELPQDAGAVHYTVELVDSVTGKPVSFPESGLDITFAYPEGTNKTGYEFKLFCFTEGLSGQPTEMELKLTDEEIAIHAGSAGIYSLYYTKKEAVPIPVVPSENETLEGTETGLEVTGNEVSNTATETSENGTPQTGDASAILPFAAILFVAGAVIIAILKKRSSIQEK